MEQFDCEIQTEDLYMSSHEDQTLLLAEHSTHLARLEQTIQHLSDEKLLLISAHSKALEARECELAT